MKKGIMSKDDVSRPVRVIISKKAEVLRDLLKEYKVYNQVKAGNRIVLSDGKSLTDLDLTIPSGKRLVVVSIDALGGG